MDDGTGVASPEVDGVSGTATDELGALDSLDGASPEPLASPEVGAELVVGDGAGVMTGSLDAGAGDVAAGVLGANVTTSEGPLD